MISIWIFAYLLSGIFAGFFAGLLGIGGGIMMVPMLLFIFEQQGLGGQALMKVAFATSMAAIMFTSVSSFRIHHKLGNVRWDIVKRAVPGVAIGIVIGAFIIKFIDIVALTAIFLAFVLYIATDMMVGFKKPKASRQLPPPIGQGIFGMVVGVLSFLLSAGGGFLTVPFLTWCNIDIRKAIGTSAALGFPIAVFGSIGYILNGLSVAGRPEPSLGYIYLPALLGIILMSVIFAPIGAKASQKLNPVPLKRLFAAILYITAIKMGYGLLTN